MDTLVEFGGWLASIVGVAILGLIVVRFARQRLLKRIHSSERLPDGRKKQIQTIVQVGGWLVNVALIAMALMMLLSRFVDTFKTFSNDFETLKSETGQKLEDLLNEDQMKALAERQGALGEMIRLILSSEKPEKKD